jgi:hypothetical protein
VTSEQKPPLTLTELRLTPEMKKAINTATASSVPISVAYMGEGGEPQISYRGSLQAYGDTQLAIWVRKPKGGILDAMARNSRIALLYGNLNPAARGFMTIHGRGRIDNTETVRRTVYANSPDFERERDPEQKGVPLIIDLDRVDGFFGGAVLAMRR